MTKSAVIAALLVASASASLSAELKYTVRMEMKKSAAPSPLPANALLAMMGDGLSKQMLPEGPTDIVYTIGERGTRVELTKAAMGQPGGSITLSMPDGTLAILNPKDQTYWKSTMQSAASALQAAGITPQATAKRTGEFDSVAGTRCERVLFDIRIDLPIPESARASLPPGFPASLSMAGESCITTDRYQKYAELGAKGKTADFLSALGLDKLIQGGIVLRQVLRLSDQELEAVVTSIVEEDVPASQFAIPAGYKEVPAPTGVI